MTPDATPMHDDADATHRLALPPGFELEGYRIEGLLGKGGFGMTYLARDLALDMKVAIKEMLPDGIATRVVGNTVVAQTKSLQSSFDWALQRFQEEARNLARLNHPNIVRVQRLLHLHGTVYMIMEFVEGQSLTSWLEKNPKPREQDLLGILMPLLDGLEYVHSQGLLHRDIKPDNIYLTSTGRPVLLDFGSAKVDTGRTVTMTTVVSDGYSPFEQYQQKGRQGAFTDLYSLAGVMIRAVTGEKPPSAPDRVTVQEEPLAKSVKGRCSETFLRALDTTFAVHAQQRPQTVAEFRALLQGAVPTQRASTTPRTATFQGAPERKRGARVLLLSSLALVATGLGALAVLMLQKQDHEPAPTPPTPKSVPAVATLIEKSPTPAPPVPVKAAPVKKKNKPAPAPASIPVPAKPSLPDNVVAALALIRDGDKALTRGDYPQATQKYRLAREECGGMRRDPAELAALAQAEFGLAECFFDRALFREAEKAFTRVLDVKPEHPMALVRRGQCWFKLTKKKDAQAIAAFREALDHDPSCWQALVAWGSLLTNRATNEQEERAALVKLTAAEALGATGPDFHLARSCVFSGLKDTHQKDAEDVRSLELLYAAIVLNPKSARLYLEQAVLLNRQGKSQESLAATAKANELTPDTKPALFTKAYELNDKGKTDQEFTEAIAILDELIQAAPDEGKYVREKAYSLKKLKRYSEALALCNQDVRDNPLDSGAYSYRGDVYDAMDKLQESLTDYTKAIELKPSALGYNKRAGVLRQLGRTTEADADAAKAKELEKPKT